MFFNPNRAAFRAGHVTGTEWDNANIGNYSTAMGSNTSASGNYSTAMGYNTSASANRSTAMGSGTIASGYISTAMGSNTTASGSVSTAMGSSTSAPSYVETVIGRYNTPYTPANTTNWSATDRLFVVGNGTGVGLESNAMVILKSGNVGIGTSIPNASLSVNGVANKPGGGAWSVISDKRLKENISEYSEGLELIRKVRPVSFSYNSKMTEIWGENEQIKGKVYQGVIAQDLQKIAPDMVREVNVAQKDGTPGESFLEVDPNKFTYALINAVQEQQKQIDAQQEQMQAQQEQLQELMVEIKALKEANK